MAKVTGELGAVVGGTEEATQQILEAAEAIDQAATAMTKVNSPDQQKLLSEEIGERVVSIFEACNFQDLTGQRISKVMTTMKFIENHITVMMDIWGGVDAIRTHAPSDRRRSGRRRPPAQRPEAATATSAMPRRTTSTPCSTEFRSRAGWATSGGGALRKNAGSDAGVFCLIPSLRASAQAIRKPTKKAWIASSLALLAVTKPPSYARGAQRT